MKWADDVDRQLLLTTIQFIVELTCVDKILFIGGVADFSIFDDVIKGNFFQLREDILSIYIGVFDFLFDVFFLIGEVFVMGAITLNVSLLFEKAQCLLNIFPVLGVIGIKLIQHQDTDVPDRRFKALDVFHEK